MYGRLFLHGEAGIDFQQLGHGLLGLLVVAGPGVGGGEWSTCSDALAAPASALLHHSIACSHCAKWVWRWQMSAATIWGTLGSRGLRRNAVSSPAKPSSARPRYILKKLRAAWASALFGLSAIAASASAIACGHWRFCVEHTLFRIMRRRIVRLDAVTARSALSSARAMSLFGSSLWKILARRRKVRREADHRRDKLGIDRERALEKTDGGVIA